MYDVYKIVGKKFSTILYESDVFGPLLATTGDTPNRPKMTTKN